MPSASLLRWRNERLPRLAVIDAQCAASLALAPPNPALVEENLRGYVLLLSAHFQGFSRDLYSECAVVIVSRVRPSLRPLVLSQFRARRLLDHGNPNLDTLRNDFQRFGLTLDFVAADPGNAARLADLAVLNRWRNIAAHEGAIPAGWVLDLRSIQSWRDACDGLAASLDLIMYNQLKVILRRRPWTP